MHSNILLRVNAFFIRHKREEELPLLCRHVQVVLGFLEREGSSLTSLFKIILREL